MQGSLAINFVNLIGNVDLMSGEGDAEDNSRQG